MSSIKRYQKVTDAYTTHKLVPGEADAIELATLDDGYTYVHVAGQLPAQPNQINVEDVTPTPELRAAIVGASLHIRALHRLNSEIHAKKTTEGVVHVFPDGLAGVVQTRHGTDLANVNAVAAAGLALSAAGETNPVLVFRTEDNVSHALTPAQAVEMGLAVTAALSAVYQRKWDIDAQIDSLEGLHQLNLAAAWQELEAQA